MEVRQDPEQNETEALLSAVPDWAGMRVLEIGCGNGRLTFRYASLPASVEAIDPDTDDIAAARRSLPSELAGRVRFHAVNLEDFEPEAGEPFDIALLSWSL
jgi:predicted RNA methylase